MTTDTEKRLRAVLHAASSLVEAPQTPKRIGHTDTETLSSILARRLAGFLARIEGEEDLLEPSEVASVRNAVDADNEVQSKALTAAMALRCISEVAALLRSPSLPSSSSAPPLGARDAKLLQTLAGIVARWGIAAQVQEGILPSSLRDKQAGDPDAKAKVVELQGDDGLAGVRDLDTTTRELIDIVSAPTGVTRADLMNPLRSILLPSLLVPLIAALLQLGFGDFQRTWAREALERLLNQCAVFHALPDARRLTLRFCSVPPPLLSSLLCFSWCPARRLCRLQHTATPRSRLCYPVAS